MVLNSMDRFLFMHFIAVHRETIEENISLSSKVQLIPSPLNEKLIEVYEQVLLPLSSKHSTCVQRAIKAISLHTSLDTAHLIH